MNYYELIPLGGKTRGINVATYSSEKPLNKGEVHLVPFGKREIPAVVFNKVAKPKSFSVKPIPEQTMLEHVPGQLLELAQWFSEYYASDLPTSLRTMLPSGIHKKRRKQSMETSGYSAKPIKLRDDQQKIVDSILKKVDGKHLIEGVTGSGKTYIYASIVSRLATQGKSSILLAPEIALSQHILEKVQKLTSIDVIHMHSNLTEAKKHLLWQKAKSASAPVLVVGPRSAVFSPLQNLGAIIIDESHDSSYKQDSFPHYSAMHVAAKRTDIEKALLINGTATPSVESQFLIENKRIHKHSLPRKHFKQKHQIHVIDRRDKSAFSQNSLLSNQLISALKESYKRGKQSLLFVNRRGFAPLVHCQQCHWQLACEQCQLPMTYHTKGHTCKCHICGLSRNLPTSCPECGNADIRLSGVGTQKIEYEIERILPGSNYLRVDRDTLARQAGNSLESVDVLIGTQMLTKGFDLPNLETVGVVNADTFLFIPDFSAAERTWQTLQQVIGRNDRRGHGGTTFVQTSQPDHYAIRTAINAANEEFFAKELESREILKFPPYSYLLKITAKRKTQKGAESALNTIKKKLVASGYRVLGPAPSFHEYAYGYINWHILIKSSQRSKLVKIARSLESTNVVCELDPQNLL